MAKFFTFLLSLSFFAHPIYLQANTEDNLQNCEQITAIALEKLVPALQQNNYQQLESILGTIQSACGENEFTQRMRIIQALIERKTTGALIADYLSKNYHEILTMRWDYTVEKEHRRIYQENKADFNYVPLNHPIDSLIKLKANALLNSPSYNLTEQEEDIALLFADHLDEFYQSYEDTAPIPSATETARYREDSKLRSGMIISAGAEFPITGSDPLFKTNPTFGLFYSSSMASLILFEGGIKIRINSNDRSFDYMLYDEIEHVNSSASFSIGGNVGVKLFDNDKYIIAPKVGLYYDVTNTGLSEVDYFDNEYGESTSSVRYHNIHTMRTTLALSLMRHIVGKKYIGLEAAYHYVPYDWERNLLTTIQPNYASLQLFFRF
ncbi:hypothetical protein [Sphingobacterium griseoflavum]|uniref:Outer membrane protein beta-barrel domain-containing protein n=1 Tax=Sphingobacterium griseoflavum TaxID=1474952 RepID=A0ABQ3HR39_9SPHI|nr:hypothetical protein [Sphingobacterium griseoflavum]GHE23741.1 hypothetical protein GCM10017764_07090 [Sphingobacterium griseoflavum]